MLLNTNCWVLCWANIGLKMHVLPYRTCKETPAESIKLWASTGCWRLQSFLPFLQCRSVQAWGSPCQLLLHGNRSTCCPCAATAAWNCQLIPLMLSWNSEAGGWGVGWNATVHVLMLPCTQTHHALVSHCSLPFVAQEEKQGLMIEEDLNRFYTNIRESWEGAVTQWWRISWATAKAMLGFRYSKQKLPCWRSLGDAASLLVCLGLWRAMNSGNLLGRREVFECLFVCLF